MTPSVRLGDTNQQDARQARIIAVRGNTARWPRIVEVGHAGGGQGGCTSDAPLWMQLWMPPY